MRYTVEKNFINVLGHIWEPCSICAYEYPLKEYDIRNIGIFTRQNVAIWLSKNAGDFKEIVDFYATIGETEIEWEHEENEIEYWNIMCPEW